MRNLERLETIANRVEALRFERAGLPNHALYTGSLANVRQEAEIEHWERVETREEDVYTWEYIEEYTFQGYEIYENGEVIEQIEAGADNEAEIFNYYFGG